MAAEEMGTLRGNWVFCTFWCQLSHAGFADTENANVTGSWKLNKDFQKMPRKTGRRWQGWCEYRQAALEAMYKAWRWNQRHKSDSGSQTPRTMEHLLKKVAGNEQSEPHKGHGPTNGKLQRQERWAVGSHITTAHASGAWHGPTWSNICCLG